MYTRSHARRIEAKLFTFIFAALVSQQMANSLLIFFIGVVYVVVCPFVAVCPMLYFATTELLWRHQLYFV
jgi:hypothetical protein